MAIERFDVLAHHLAAMGRQPMVKSCSCWKFESGMQV
jgi:hypothetical protein